MQYNLLYKTYRAVVIVHQLVRPQGNSKFYHGIVAMQHRNLLVGRHKRLRFWAWRRVTCVSAGFVRQRRQRWNCGRGSTCLLPSYPSPSLPPSSSACSEFGCSTEPIAAKQGSAEPQPLEATGAGTPVPAPFSCRRRQFAGRLRTVAVCRPLAPDMVANQRADERIGLLRQVQHEAFGIGHEHRQPRIDCRRDQRYDEG